MVQVIELLILMMPHAEPRMMSAIELLAMPAVGLLVMLHGVPACEANTSRILIGASVDR